MTADKKNPPEEFVYNPEELPEDEWIEFHAEPCGSALRVVISDSEGILLNWSGLYGRINIPDILVAIYEEWDPSRDEGMLRAEIVFPWGYPYTDAKEYVEWHVRNKIFLKVLEWLKQFWVSPY